MKTIWISPVMRISEDDVKGARKPDLTPFEHGTWSCGGEVCYSCRNRRDFYCNADLGDEYGLYENYMEPLYSEGVWDGPCPSYEKEP